MIKAYILIKLVPGLESETLTQIRNIRGVTTVDLTFGQWDAIAIAEAKTLGDVMQTVISQIRALQGIQDTQTLVAGVI